ncbi:dihydrofolate reductase family protein [Streptosporangium sp. CA-135522]|uniref:dihydrofolate reductase family protein n=1 Tax=Streptosporangium sp. CA-135522 TaxID=3240072 RepID=UPI003D89D25F
MSKIVAVVRISMDGVLEEFTPFWDEEEDKFQRGQLFASRALLLGRKTYDAMSKVWRAMTHEDDFAARMNSIPKYVASTTLSDAGWSSVVIKGDVAEQVAKLKREPGRDLLVYGSAALVNHLIEHGLLDELKLLLRPVVVGAGRQLFPSGVAITTWALAGTTVFSSGAVVLDYRPVGFGG